MEEMAFSTNGARTSERLSINKKINLDISLTSPTKINSKCITDLRQNVKL